MLFNSPEFLLFLPIVFGLYWFVTQRNLKAQNLLLLVASFRYTPEYTIKSLILRLVIQLEVLLVALFHLCTQSLALLHFRTMLLDERVHVLLWFAQC